jgi:hypothetical protein
MSNAGAGLAAGEQGRPRTVEWGGAGPGSAAADGDAVLAAAAHGAAVTVDGRLQAATRDASFLDRPDVRSVKAAHVVVVSHDLAIGGGTVSGTAAACDPRRILIDDETWRDWHQVTEAGRCRRSGCARLYAQAASALAAEQARARAWITERAIELDFVRDRSRCLQPVVHVAWPHIDGDERTIGWGDGDAFVAAMLTPGRMLCDTGLFVNPLDDDATTVPVQVFADEELCPRCVDALGDQAWRAFEHPQPPGTVL